MVPPPLSTCTCPSDGTLNGAPCQGYQPHRHAKNRFISMKRGLVRAARETLKFQN